MENSSSRRMDGSWVRIASRSWFEYVCLLMNFVFIINILKKDVIIFIWQLRIDGWPAFYPWRQNSSRKGLGAFREWLAFVR
jgi:hypothetical protein